MPACRTMLIFLIAYFLVDFEYSYISALLRLFGTCVFHNVVGLFLLVTH